MASLQCEGVPLHALVFLIIDMSQNHTCHSTDSERVHLKVYAPQPLSIYINRYRYIYREREQFSSTKESYFNTVWTLMPKKLPFKYCVLHNLQKRICFPLNIHLQSEKFPNDKQIWAGEEIPEYFVTDAFGLCSAYS